MIACKPRDRTITNQIKPAISDMGKMEARALNDQRRARSAHTVKSRMPVGIILNSLLGHGKGL